MKKRYPTQEQLRALKASGWRRVLDGLAWQSPYDDYYYSPAKAVAIEARR